LYQYVFHVKIKEEKQFIIMIIFISSQSMFFMLIQFIESKENLFLSQRNIIESKSHLDFLEEKGKKYIESNESKLSPQDQVDPPWTSWP